MQDRMNCGTAAECLPPAPSLANARSTARGSIGILAGGWLMAVTATAAADQDPRQIIRQAIPAMGGIENARLIRAMHTKFAGRIYLEEGRSAELQGEVWQQFPDRSKQIMQINLNGKKRIVLYAVRGEDAWSVEAGVQRQLEGPARFPVCVKLYEDYVSSLLPLLEDRRFALTTVPVKPVNGRPAHGVRVAMPKEPTMPDVTLFFDEETHLLVLKQRGRFDRPRVYGVERVTEELLFDYRTIDFRIDDAKRLRQAGIDTTDASLLAFLKRQVPSQAGRAQCQKLIDELGDNSYAVRKNARDELARFGTAAVPLLGHATTSRDLDVSAAANELLQKASAESTDTGPIPSALRLLADRRPPGAIQVILAYLPTATSDLLASAAQKALVELSTIQGKPDPSFENMLAFADPGVRATAQRALESARRAAASNGGQQLFPKGLKFPFLRQIYHEGKREQEITVLEVGFYSQLPDSIFANPP
jgi:hypothetical protein